MTHQSKKSIAVMFASLLVSMSMHGAALAAPDNKASAESVCETWDELGNYAARTEFMDSFIKSPETKKYLELASLWEKAARPQTMNYCKKPQASQLSANENTLLSKFFVDSGLNRDEVYAVAVRVKHAGGFAGSGSAALTDKEKALFTQLVRHSADLRNIYSSTDDRIAAYLKQRGLALADLKEF